MQIIHNDAPRSEQSSETSKAARVSKMLNTVSSYVTSLSMFDHRKEKEAEICEILDCLAADIEDAEDRANSAITISRWNDEKLDRASAAIERLKSDIYYLQLEVSRIAKLVDSSAAGV